jgi:hypothetical protein
MHGQVATTPTTLATPATRSRTQRCFMRSVATKLTTHLVSVSSDHTAGTGAAAGGPDGVWQTLPEVRIHLLLYLLSPQWISSEAYMEEN